MVGTDRQLLEAAATQADASGTRPRRLFEAAVQFLTYGGESAILAAWIKDVLLAEGRPIPPHDGMPEVSIIIPCHNYGKYLDECVKSVLHQSFRAWEVIIINDGSTDETHEVAQAIQTNHPDHAIRYYQQECKGIVQPRNRGATLARGEFILPLDADDLIAPQFLDKTVAMLRSHPELGYVSTKALFFGSVNSIWPAEPFSCINLLITNQQTNTTLYRKRMWQEIGGYDERMIHGYMDWEFWIRATKHGWIGTQLDEPLFFYRRKTDSVVMKAKKNDVAIKEQIVRLHPDIYDVHKLNIVRNDMCQQNRIPLDLIRDDIRLPARLPDQSQSLAHRNHAKKALLDLLGQLLPNMKDLFLQPSAGQGDPSIYQELASRLSNKSRERIKQGDHDRAIEIAASLLALYPASTSAAVLMIQVMIECSKILEAYTIASHYTSVFPMHRDIRDITADLLKILAKISFDNAYSMALLDAACILAPARMTLWTEFAACANSLGQLRTAKRALAAARGNPSHFDNNIPYIWYVTDTFGFGAGGVNGVTQAKFMTLSSVIRGQSGPDVIIVTKWHPGFPEAIAEFADFTKRVCGEDGFRWPMWIPLEQEQQPEQLLRLQMVSKPSLLIEEGVLLEGHRFLKTLPWLPDCPKVFMHHTSPQQYTGKFEYSDIFDEAIHAFAQYDHHICVSNNVLQEWKGINGLGQKHWTYIPNCAPEEETKRLLKLDQSEVRRSLGLPENAMIYLCLASVQTRKGHDVLIEQIEEVFHKIENALLLCIGPVHAEWSGLTIMETARQRYGSERVRFLGIRRNALEYVRACDCLVLPSREEALPLVILEAMALEKPCVASDVNGIPELVIHGDTGLLFSLQNPRDLAKHMIAIATDAHLARTMGKKAKNRYENYFCRTMHASRWRALIHSIINNPDENKALYSFESPLPDSTNPSNACLIN